MKTIEWKKIGVGAALAVAGALVTYGATIIPEIEQAAPLIGAAASIALNVARKWLQTR